MSPLDVRHQPKRRTILSLTRLGNDRNINFIQLATFTGELAILKQAFLGRVDDYDAIIAIHQNLITTLNRLCRIM